MHFGPNKSRQAIRLDWRWATACELSQLDDVAATVRLKQFDAQVRECYLFKRSSDRGLDIDPSDPIAVAHDVWVNRLAERNSTECMLIGGLDAEKAASDGGSSMEAPAIRAFHDLFFDVGPFLQRSKITALVNLLFNGSPYGGLSGRDRFGQAMRMSWLLGWDVYRAHLHGQLFSDEQVDVFKAMMRDLAYKMGYLNLQTMSGRGELDIQVVNLAMDDIQKVAKKIGGQQGGKAGQQEILHELGTMVMETVRTFTPSIADPTKTSNLSLSKREPRAHELLQGAAP